MEHDTSDEVVADTIESVAQDRHRTGVSGVGNGARLDFDGDDPTIEGLDDAVDLEPIALTEVMEASRRVVPRELLGDLVDDERLDERAGRRFVQARQRGR